MGQRTAGDLTDAVVRCVTTAQANLAPSRNAASSGWSAALLRRACSAIESSQLKQLPSMLRGLPPHYGRSAQPDEQRVVCTRNTLHGVGAQSSPLKTLTGSLVKSPAATVLWVLDG